MKAHAYSSFNENPDYSGTETQMTGGSRSSTPSIVPQSCNTRRSHHSAHSSTNEPQHIAGENLSAHDKGDQPAGDSSKAAPPATPRAQTDEQLPEPRKILQIPIPSSSNQEVGHRLVNFLGEYSSLKATGSRNYDYLEKYEEDNTGEETGPDARVFKVYNDEAEKYDDDMVRGLTNSLDALLVFASLFSAVVTTFLVQTAQALETDQTMVTNYLLIEQIQLLRANGNSSAISDISPSSYGPESTTYENSDILINGFFVASLALSLATALLSVVAKQWLQAYMAVTSGSARDIAMIRQLRFNGFMKWKMHELIGALPLILHASLGVFSAGLVFFLRSLYTPLSWIVVGISGLVFSFYLASIIVPAIDLSCPYRIPVLYGPSRYGIHLATKISRLFRRCFAAVSDWWSGRTPNQIDHLLNLLSRNVIRPSRGALGSVGSHLRNSLVEAQKRFLPQNMGTSDQPSPNWSLKAAEASQVHEDNQKALTPLVCEGVLWLHGMSSNKTLRYITAWSLAGEAFHGNSPYIYPSYVRLVYKDPIIYSLLQSLHESTDLMLDGLGHRASENIRRCFNVQLLKMPPPQVSQTLFPAARHNRSKYISYVLESWNADVNTATTEWSGGSMLIQAAENGHLKTAELLLDHGADINPKHRFYGSALTAASRSGHLDVVKLLLDHEADPNLRVGFYGHALQAASLSGHLAIIKLLLDHGAEVNLRGGGHDSALIAASIYSRLDAVQLLLDHGADPNIKGGFNSSALQAATQNGHLDVIKLLLNHGADPNIQIDSSDSAIQTATRNGHLDIIKLLLDHGADINLQDGIAGTALHIASLSGQLDVVKLLLDHGADTILQNPIHGSALQAASKRGHLDVVSLLREHGAV